MPRGRPLPPGSHRLHVFTAPLRPDERPAPGSQDDIVDKILKFWKFWRGHIGDLPRDVASSSKPNIHRGPLTEYEARYYNIKAIYNVSGFVEHGCYSPLNVANENDKFVTKSPEIPRAFVRSVPVRQPRNSIEVDQLWVQKELEPSLVWKHEDNRETVLANKFCFPRCMPAQPLPTTPDNQQMAMQRWLLQYNEPYNPYFDSEAILAAESWLQLPGRGDVHEERQKGSPSTPLISVLRLTVATDANTTRSVLVVFRIVDNKDGTFRPWGTGDPLVPRLWIPPPPPPLPPVRVDPGVDFSRPRSPSPSYRGPPADLRRYQDPFSEPLPPRQYDSEGNLIRPGHQHSYSLTHRQRKVYNQDFARGAFQGRSASF